MKLRDYQELFYEHIINSDKEIECICAPTGSGKTVVFAAVTDHFYKNTNSNIIIVVNRRELLFQTRKTLHSFGIIPVLLTPGTKGKPIGKVMIAMAETLFRRRKKWNFNEYDIAIIDEAHRGEYMKLIEGFKRVVGFTATPIYIKKGKSLEDYYKYLYSPIQISDLIESGWLARPVTYVPKSMAGKFKIKMGDYDESEQGKELQKAKYINTVIEYWKARKDKNALVFNTTIEHSIAVEEALREAGANVIHVDAGTDKKTRDEIRYRLETESGLWVCNVGVLTFGFDSDSIEVVMINRKTKSIALYNQMAGRGCRISDTKNSFEILDMHGSCIECGTWDEDKNWSFLFSKSKNEKAGVSPVKFCPQCDGVVNAAAVKCKLCGYEFEVKEPVVFIDNDPDLTVYERKIKEETKRLINTARERGWKPFKVLRDMIFKEINQSNLERRESKFDYIVEQFITQFGYKPSMKHYIFNEYIPKLIDEDRRRITEIINHIEKY